MEIGNTNTWSSSMEWILGSLALGIILGDYIERPVPAVWPDGWAPDTAPFYCGLDPTTRELTAQDRRNLEEWYERLFEHSRGPR